MGVTPSIDPTGLKELRRQIEGLKRTNPLSSASTTGGTTKWLDELGNVQLTLGLLEDGSYGMQAGDGPNMMLINENVIHGADIQGASVTGATITGGDINGTSITGSEIDGTAITGGTITGASVTAGSITGVNITGGDIQGTTIEATTITATSDAFFKSGRPWVDVRAYGAVGDGATDDTAAINLAISSLTWQGGTVYFSPGTYRITSPVIVNGDGISIYGAARGSTDSGVGAVLKIGATFTGSAMLQIQQSGTPTRPLHGITVSHIVLDGNSKTGTNVDGVYWQAYNSLLFDVEVADCSGNGIHAQGVASASWNTYNCKFSHTLCHDNGASGLYFDNNSDDTQEIAVHSFDNGLDGTRVNNATDHLMVSCHHYGNAGHGINLVGACPSSSVVNCMSETNGKAGFYFDDTSAGAYNVVIQGCIFFSNGLGANNTWDHLMVSPQNSHGTNVIVTGCQFMSFNGGNKPRYGVSLTSQAQSCIVSNCVFMGTWGTAPMLATGNASSLFCAVRGNVGVNPAGNLGPPSVPSSGSAFQNPYNYDATVFVAGGTVTDVAIGGTSTGLTSGSFRIPAGQTITLTYSVAPTWRWLGD